MTKAKTTEQFKKDVLQLGKGKYILRSDYTLARNKVKITHLICGRTYEVTPKDFISGRRCSKCMARKTAKNARMSFSDFYCELPDKVKKMYIVYDEGYTAASGNILVECKTCHTKRKVRGDSLKGGCGCPACNACKYKDTYTKSTVDYYNYVRNVTSGDYILLGEYTGVKNKIRIKHNLCGTVYDTFPYLFNKGRRCPHCNYSLGEYNVRQILSKTGLVFHEQVSFSGLEDVKPLTYDFYIPSNKTLIEYQGVQHYKPRKLFGGIRAFNTQVRHDLIKKEYAKDNGYKLICIPYTCNSIKSIEEFLKSVN